MKPLFLVVAATAMLFAFTPNNDVKEELAIGSSIPMAELKMKDISGKDFNLNELKKENGLVVIFSCNTCPYVKLYEDRYVESYLHSKTFNVGFVLVNSNEAYRGKEDSYDAMKKHAEEKKYQFPYLTDVNSVLADAFGANKTPHVFVFDKNGKLVYKGAIDNNPKDIAGVTEMYLRDAIGFISQGKEMKVNATKSVGCSIKRVVSDKKVEENSKTN